MKTRTELVAAGAVELDDNAVAVVGAWSGNVRPWRALVYVPSVREWAQGKMVGAGYTGFCGSRVAAVNAAYKLAKRHARNLQQMMAKPAQPVEADGAELAELVNAADAGDEHARAQLERMAAQRQQVPSYQLTAGRVLVDASRYEWAHGRKPSGRGTWGFHRDFNVAGNDPSIIWVSGLYSYAKAVAQRAAAERGWADLSVLS